MKKKITENEILDKLGKACLEMENAPKFEDDSFKNKYISEISKNNARFFNRKLIFSLINSALALILIITSLVLFIPRDTKRYTDNDDEITKLTVTIDEFIESVPENFSYLIEINTDQINRLYVYKMQNNTMACLINYDDESYMFVTFTKNFLYSEQNLFNGENTNNTNTDKYNMYETFNEVKVGRKTYIDYYLWIETNTYDYYINIKKSTTDKQNLFKEKIFENI